MITKLNTGLNPDQLAKAVQAFGKACKVSIEFGKESWSSQIKNLSTALGTTNRDSLKQYVQLVNQAKEDGYLGDDFSNYAFRHPQQNFHAQLKVIVRPEDLPETMEIVKGLSPLLWESFTLFLRHGYSPHTAFKVCNSIGQFAKQHPAIAIGACSRQEMIDKFTELCLKPQTGKK